FDCRGNHAEPKQFVQLVCRDFRFPTVLKFQLHTAVELLHLCIFINRFEYSVLCHTIEFQCSFFRKSHSLPDVFNIHELCAAQEILDSLSLEDLPCLRIDFDVCDAH